jgi:transcription initiation factor TFIIIB Brf1 subunit/transcription initiation factor TFIIB
MPFVHLRRGAPEVQNAAVGCSICGPHAANRVHDHLLIGTPGTPSHDGGVCETCGRVLEQAVAKVGPELSVRVEHAQHEASERDAPAMARGRRR